MDEGYLLGMGLPIVIGLFSFAVLLVTPLQRKIDAWREGR
jgi:hypothetical protein